MPYDPSKSKELLKIAAAHASHPMGEFTGKIADQLIEAEAEIREANSRISTAQSARNKAEAELETATQTIHRLRAGSNGMTDLVDALKAIAINPKGAAKLAKETLAKVNGGVA